VNSLLKRIHEDLGIQESQLAANRLVACEQPPLDQLVLVDIDFEGKPFLLTSPAAEAWNKMLQAAKNDGVLLEPFSGFRSYLYQKQLIIRKLEKGRPLETILTETAIPGYSEHHTGCAVDISTDRNYKLDENFENTAAFTWLTKNANRFNFHLSYPRNNTKGIVYEPWHWCFKR
jgi:D-alanyl-D-alanine carboxypeptidase